MEGAGFLIASKAPEARTTAPRARWAWFACWLPLIADLAYTLTFGRHDPAILRTSLIADIALPVLLLVQAPAFFGTRTAAARQPRRA